MIQDIKAEFSEEVKSLRQEVKSLRKQHRAHEDTNKSLEARVMTLQEENRAPATRIECIFEANKERLMEIVDLDKFMKETWSVLDKLVRARSSADPNSKHPFISTPHAGYAAATTATINSYEYSPKVHPHKKVMQQVSAKISTAITPDESDNLATYNDADFECFSSDTHPQASPEASTVLTPDEECFLSTQCFPSEASAHKTKTAVPSKTNSKRRLVNMSSQPRAKKAGADSDSSGTVLEQRLNTLRKDPPVSKIRRLVRHSDSDEERFNGEMLSNQEEDEDLRARQYGCAVECLKLYRDYRAARGLPDDGDETMDREDEMEVSAIELERLPDEDLRARQDACAAAYVELFRAYRASRGLPDVREEENSEFESAVLAATHRTVVINVSENGDAEAIGFDGDGDDLEDNIASDSNDGSEIAD